MRLENAVAIITGGGAGFGKDFANRICRNGGRVVLADINNEAGIQTCRELNDSFESNCATFVPMDITDMSAFDRLFDICKEFFNVPANVLINNAGILGHGTFYDKNQPSDWEAIIHVNLTSVIRGTQVAMNRMKGSGHGGLIINVASVAGLMPVKQVPVYAASKWGVVGFSRSCVRIAAKDGIRVNVICPSFCDTSMGRLGLSHPQIKLAIEEVGGLIPIGHVSDAVEQLIEDESKTGKIVRVLPYGIDYHKFARL